MVLYNIVCYSKLMLCYAQLELYCVDADFDWLHNLQIIPRNFCCIFIGFKKKFSTELLNKVNILYCIGNDKQ